MRPDNPPNADSTSTYKGLPLRSIPLGFLLFLRDYAAPELRAALESEIARRPSVELVEPPVGFEQIVIDTLNELAPPRKPCRCADAARTAKEQSA